MSMDRRQFLSRLLKGIAVAAVAPEVIAKACEEARIPKGTVFSFGPRGVDTWTLPPHWECQFDRVWGEIMAKQMDHRLANTYKWEKQDMLYIDGTHDNVQWVDDVDAQLLEDFPQVTHQSFEEVRALQSGKIDTFVGFDFVRTPLLKPTLTDRLRWAVQDIKDTILSPLTA